MTRKNFRCILVGLLVLSGAIAAWAWMRPYEWSADSKARCHIIGCQVERDHSNYWVSLQIGVRSDQQHDLEQPVRLLTKSGRILEPADTTLEGDEKKPIRKIWLKFWLEKEDLEGPLSLKINEGELKVRSGAGLPKLNSDGRRNFVTHRW